MPRVTVSDEPFKDFVNATSCGLMGIVRRGVASSRRLQVVGIVSRHSGVEVLADPGI